MYWVLIKKGCRHAVLEGSQSTLCGENIKNGTRGRDVVYPLQLSCIVCRKEYALSSRPISEIRSSKEQEEQEPVTYVSSGWRLIGKNDVYRI